MAAAGAGAVAAAADPSLEAAFQASLEALAARSVAPLDEKHPEQDWHRWARAIKDLVATNPIFVLGGPAVYVAFRVNVHSNRRNPLPGRERSTLSPPSQKRASTKGKPPPAQVQLAFNPTYPRLLHHGGTHGTC